MDFLDWLVIQFVAKKMQLPEDTVKNVFFAGKPWMTTDYTDKLINQSRQMGLDPGATLTTTIALQKQEAEQATRDRAEGKTPEFKMERLRLLHEKFDRVATETGIDRQTIDTVVNGIRDYVTFVAAELGW